MVTLAQDAQACLGELLKAPRVAQGAHVKAAAALETKTELAKAKVEYDSCGRM